MPYEAKTKPTALDAREFLQTVEDENRRADAVRLLEMMQNVTGEPPVLWGPSIVGFGSYRYQYPTGHGGTAAATGFSPRKSALTVYVAEGFEAHPDLMARLGKYRTGKSCLYVKRLSDIDETVLEELIRRSLAYLRRRYPA